MKRHELELSVPTLVWSLRTKSLVSGRRIASAAPTNRSRIPQRSVVTRPQRGQRCEYLEV